jgi:UDP-N-acetyl-L-fucosamine synthase
MRVMTIVGTRPEVIRLSRVIPKLDEYTDHILVHTGQNYDYELNQIFFDELGLPAPAVVFSSDTSTLGRFLADVLVQTEEAITAHKPDAMLVLGDTNSCIAAVIGRRMRVPIFHMEAGNRSWDLDVPEETNRRLVDHVSDFNLAYTEHARSNLLREGFHPRKVYVTGSPMHEVLLHYRQQIEASNVLEQEGLTSNGYFMVSMHREENVDAPEHLANVLDILDGVATTYGLPVVVSTHPRTRKRLDSQSRRTHPNVTFAKPFGFFDYNALQLHARCVLSDSGTISEESSMLGFPAVTPRNAIERPEALDAGAIVLASTDPTSVLQSIDLVLRQWDSGWRPHRPLDYQVTDTSDRVVRLIAGLGSLRARWDNLH